MCKIVIEGEKIAKERGTQNLSNILMNRKIFHKRGVLKNVQYLYGEDGEKKFYKNGKFATITAHYSFRSLNYSTRERY